MEQQPVLGDGTKYLNAIALALGVIPAESLVLLPLAQGRSRVVLRFDLPPAHATTNVTAYAHTVLGYAMRLPDADGVVAAMFTQASVSNRKPPFQPLADALACACAEAGFPLRAAVWQARDARGEFGGTQRFGLGEEVTLVPLRDVNEMLRIVPAPTARRAHIHALIDELKGAPIDGSVFGEIWRALAAEPGDATAPVEYAVREEFFAISALGLAELDGVGRCTMQAAFSLLNEDALDRLGIAIKDAEGYAFATADFSEITVRAGEPIDRLGTAVTSALLRELISLTEDRWHAGPYAALAWLAWARGESSAALWYAEHSLEAGAHEPPHSLAELVANLSLSGVVPSWFGATGCDPGPPPRVPGAQARDAHWFCS